MLLVYDLGNFTKICKEKKSWVHSDVIPEHQSETSLSLLCLLHFCCSAVSVRCASQVMSTSECDLTLLMKFLDLGMDS